MKRREALVGLGSMAVTTACGGSGLSPTAQGPDIASSPVPNPTQSHTLVGAGDIGWKGLAGADVTAKLLDDISGTVFTAGDNIYLNGNAAATYPSHFGGHWGRHKHRIRPSLGNHDYELRDARPYHEYFGAMAGPDSLGYYDYLVGNWLIMVFNSCVPCDKRSSQYRWAEAKLKSTPVRTIGAYWHHPLVSSGQNGHNPYMADLWELLHRHRASFVVAGHDHLYERCAPMTNAGKADSSGPRQFIVGTGGAKPYAVRHTLGVSEKIVVGEPGVLKLDLGSDRFNWKFIGSGGLALDEGEQVLA